MEGSKMCQMLSDGLRYAAHNAVTYGAKGAEAGAWFGFVFGAFDGLDNAFGKSGELQFAKKPPLSFSGFYSIVGKTVIEDTVKYAAYGFAAGACVGITVTALEALAHTASVIASGCSRCIRARAIPNG